HLASLPPLTPIKTHLPLGISSFTFQLISYVVDIYRGKIRAEHAPSRLATYIMMFPHLIAGPIVRYADIAAELRKRQVTLDRVGLGIQYFIVGLCQKVLIANTVAQAADTVFALPPDQLRSLAAWLGTLAYTLQIYFDFCGYSNMAIGLAFLLGFHFPKNFDYPYGARSITEFWRRWHMTLSFWFRDYVYIALGGNRKGQLKTVRNLIIVFFLTGLWHGASWTFVIWGLYHGLFLLLERVGFGRILERIPTVLRVAYTVFVVMIGWVFFRAATFTQALVFFKAMFGRPATVPETPPTLLWLTPEIIVALAAGILFSFPIVPRLLDSLGRQRIARATMFYPEARLDTLFVHPLPVSVLISGLALCIVLLASGSLNPFLYFRF
ncbi:MAG: MBOAT family protein, partial [Acidobacteriaceae bacterium]|nr:MBOAT family protein [Acidobacteriaceae bacterium]